MAGARRTRRGTGENERRRVLAGQLSRIAGELGPNLTLRRFCREAGIPSSHIYRDFETWRELRTLAGLSPCRKGPSAAAVQTRESLIAALRGACDEAGTDLSRREFHVQTGISAGPVRRLFGSWRAFRRAAGLSACVSRLSRTRWTREELLDVLREVSRDRPHLTLAEFCAECGVSNSTVDRLGPWSALRKALCLPLRGSRHAARWHEWGRQYIDDRELSVEDSPPAADPPISLTTTTTRPCWPSTSNEPDGSESREHPGSFEEPGCWCP